MARNVNQKRVGDHDPFHLFAALVCVVMIASTSGGQDPVPEKKAIGSTSKIQKPIVLDSTQGKPIKPSKRSAYGVVVDERGKPISGVKVQAASPRQGFYSSFSMPTGGEDLPGKTAVTDSEGRFRIDGIVPRRWYPDKTGNMPVMLRFRTPYRWINDGNYFLDQELRVVLYGSGKRGELRLKLLDAQTGKPVTRFMVVRRHDPTMEESIDEAGEYEHPGNFTRHDNFMMYCYALGYEAIEVRVEALDPDSDARTVVRLKPRPSLQLRIIDAKTEKPVGDARVMASILEGEMVPARAILWGTFDRFVDGYYSLQFVQRKSTDRDGRVAFSQLPVGDPTLYVLAEGYQRTIIRSRDRDLLSKVQKTITIRLKEDAGEP